MGIAEINKRRNLPKLAKSKNLAAGKNVPVKRLEGTDPVQYVVPSQSKPGTDHTVTVYDLADGDVRCDCSGYMYQGACTHVGIVANMLESGVEIQRAEPAEDVNGGVGPTGSPKPE